MMKCEHEYRVQNATSRIAATVAATARFHNRPHGPSLTCKQTHARFPFRRALRA